jgi:hypothetical protein
MERDTVRVHIFETTAELGLDTYRCKETKPLYAAMIPGSDSYYCFTEILSNLPEELARVAGENTTVVPTNLPKKVYFKEIKLGDSEQTVAVIHKPLSQSKLEEFVSTAIGRIGQLNRHQKRYGNKESEQE